VRAQAGVTWGELDRATQLFGLATPGGEVSVTGIAGLTLGGGLGVLQRRFGLSCDNLRSIEVVTGDAQVRTCNRDEHPDLFWAARGGGRGIGVVTSFEFDLHPLGPDVATAQVAYPYREAESVVRAFRDIATDAPETVAPELALWSLPADPALPESLHGAPVVLVSGVYAGPPDDAETTLAPLRSLGTPLVDMSGVKPYVDVQCELDPLIPDGIRAYMTSHFADALSDDAVGTLVACGAERPTLLSLVVVRTLGGAIDRVPRDATAFPHRGAAYNLSFDAFWEDHGADAEAIDWARRSWDATKAFSTGGVYVNFSGLADEVDELRSAIQGEHESRLARVRADYDPECVFAAAARVP
jgi:FAD/FMN-containing dehydrogenase